MIIVELTEEEALGWGQAGNAQGKQGVKDFIFIKLALNGMSHEQAEIAAERLAEAAESARQKIEAATRYEIRVVVSA